MPDITATEPAERRRQAEAWCDRFEENNRRWLKSTIATLCARRRAAIELRRRQYLADPAAAAAVRRDGRQMIEEVWRTRQRKQGVSGRTDLI